MSGIKRQKLERTLTDISVNASAAMGSIPGISTSRIPEEVNSPSSPTVFVWDPNGSIPQLLDISEVCRMLALQKSAVYNLVATGELRKPLKFGTSRRAASRWLLSDVIHFVQTLAAQRPLPSMSISGNQSLALAPSINKSKSGRASGNPNRQFGTDISNTGATQ